MDQITLEIPLMLDIRIMMDIQVAKENKQIEISQNIR